MAARLAEKRELVGGRQGTFAPPTVHEHAMQALMPLERRTGHLHGVYPFHIPSHPPPGRSPPWALPSRRCPSEWPSAASEVVRKQGRSLQGTQGACRGKVGKAPRASSCVLPLPAPCPLHTTKRNCRPPFHLPWSCEHSNKERSEHQQQQHSLAWKILTTLVPSDALTKKKGSLCLAAKLKLLDVTWGRQEEHARGPWVWSAHEGSVAVLHQAACEVHCGCL